MALTLPEPPTWMQNRSYSARLDRQIVKLLFAEGVVDIGGGELEVRETTAGPDNNLEVVAGYGVIAGDDEAIQGHYLAHVGAGGAAFAVLPMGSAPLTDQRIDLIVLRVNDTTSGSAAVPVDTAALDVIEGVAGVGPTPPALPPTAIPLAQVLRTSGDTFINNSMITDLRAPATYAQYTVFSRFEVLTTTQRDALVAPQAGRTIYNSTTNRVETFDGVAWVGTGIFAVTTTQRNALTGLYAGYTVLNTTTNSIETWNGSQWLTGGIPVVTTTERNALPTYVGLTVYNTTNNRIETFDGVNWFGVGIVPLTQTEINALTPYQGQVVYNITEFRIQLYNGAIWENIGQSYFEPLTTIERNALVPFPGQTIFNLTTALVETWDGANWIVSTGIPAYTTTERNALSVYVGQVIFNTDVNRLQIWDGAAWRDSGETYFDALTTTQRNALTPFVGQVIFNTTTNQAEVWDGSAWQAVSSSSVALSSLTDVNLAGLGDTDLLTYDNSSGDWIPLPRTSLPFATSDDVLALVIALGG